MTNTFINLLKKHTTIDKRFINTFFSKFKIGGELHFDIRIFRYTVRYIAL